MAGEGLGPSLTEIGQDPEELSGEHAEGAKKSGPMTLEEKAMQPKASEILGERGMAAMQGPPEDDEPQPEQPTTSEGSV